MKSVRDIENIELTSESGDSDSESEDQMAVEANGEGDLGGARVVARERVFS